MILTKKILAKVKFIHYMCNSDNVAWYYNICMNFLELDKLNLNELIIIYYYIFKILRFKNLL